MKAKGTQNIESVNTFQVITYILGYSSLPAQQILYGTSLTIRDTLHLLYD